MATENHISKQNNIYVRVLSPKNLDDNLDLIWCQTKQEALETARDQINAGAWRGERLVCEVRDYMKRFKPILISL